MSTTETRTEWSLRPESAQMPAEYRGKNPRLDENMSEQTRYITGAVKYAAMRGVDLMAHSGQPGPTWTVGDELAGLILQATREAYGRGCLIGRHSALHTGHISDCPDESCRSY